jgi:hydrogenase/urease accessory protein HupE
MKSLHLLCAKACWLASGVAFAHEGHAPYHGAWDGISHWFTHFDHLIALVVGAGALGALARHAWLRCEKKSSKLSDKQ